MPLRSTRLLLLLATAALIAPTAAFAAPSSLDAAAADSLYKDGVALMKNGNYDAACPKLIESQRLDPGGGTLVAIALCHEGQGRLATAVGDWDAALQQARADHNAMREQAARDHLAAVRPRLTSIRITVNGQTPGIHVVRDGAAVDEAQWGTALPVDPGTHVVEANAPGKAPWKQNVEARGEGVVVDVAVPPLFDASSAPPATPGTATTTGTPGPTTTSASPGAEPTSGADHPAASGSSRRTIGWVVGGVGVASLATGIVFGILASSDWSSAKQACPNAVCPNPADVSRGSTVQTEATLSDVLIGVGVAAAAAGVILILTAPHNPPASTGVRVLPAVGAGQVGLTAHAAF
jgi:hypothetical protein